MAVLRVSLGFAQLSDAELSDYSVTVVTKMTNNLSYPTPKVPLPDITAANGTFVAAMAAAAQGGTQLTAAKNAAREVLVALLRTQAAYVQTEAGNDLAVMLSSGFWNVSTDRTRKPLPRPAVVNIDNFATSQLMLRLKSVDNARSYEVRGRIGTQEWKPMGVFTNSRAMLLENLTPGQVYEIQVRAVGGSLGYSAWSDPILRMAT